MPCSQSAPEASETTGTQPLARASLHTKPEPSSMLGRTSASARRISSGTSLRWPSASTLGCASMSDSRSA